MRWVAAITTLILVCIAASGLTIAAPPARSVDAEVEATLGPPADAEAPTCTVTVAGAVLPGG